MGVFTDKLKNAELSLTFDDVLIKPAKSSVLPSEVDTSIRLNDRLTLSIPVFSAAMDTVTGYEMARSMIEYGACGPLHRNTSTEDNIDSIRKLKSEFGDGRPIAISIGVGISDEEIDSFIEAGANVIVVDSAHAHSDNVGNLVSHVSTRYPDIFLIAGNVVTSEGAEFLVSKGAKAVKVGIGPGSICTTRKVTGIGRGQVSSIAEVSDYLKDKGVLTIADGGIRSTDEIMKAIACGADAVMLGYMLAGCDECPGEVISIDNETYKVYRGMGSLNAMNRGSSGRYNKGSLTNCKWVPEGIEGYVRTKGKVKGILHSIEWGLKSAFGYVGGSTIMEAKCNSVLVRVTNSVLKKSNVHSIDKVI